jgi:hypothetical protein
MSDIGGESMWKPTIHSFTHYRWSGFCRKRKRKTFFFEKEVQICVTSPKTSCLRFQEPSIAGSIVSNRFSLFFLLVVSGSGATYGRVKRDGAIDGGKGERGTSLLSATDIFPIVSPLSFCSLLSPGKKASGLLRDLRSAVARACARTRSAR